MFLASKKTLYIFNRLCLSSLLLCNKYTNYFNLFKLEVIAELGVLNDIICQNCCGLQALNDNNSIVS